MNAKEKKDNLITEEDVRYIADLSRLRINDEDISALKGQLSEILGYIDKLNEVDTDNVRPTTHVLSSMKNVFRDDEKKTSLPPDEALKNAPDRKENFFKVPKIIKDA